MTENSLESSLLPNLPEFSVSELSSLLKRALEDRFEHVRVRGEISGFKRHTSGHLYLSLKDANAVLDAVCWRGWLHGLSSRVRLSSPGGWARAASCRSCAAGWSPIFC